MNKVEIVLLDGAVREESKTRELLFQVARSFDPNRVSLTLINQGTTPLPLFSSSPVLAQVPAVSQLLSAVEKADAVVLCSPEYHGSMSGALKNALDWCSLVPREFEGKVVGLMGGGGSLANAGATLQMMMAVRAMHGWMMPDVVLSVPKIRTAFDSEGDLADAALQQRLNAFTESLTRYAQLFRENQEDFRMRA